MSNDLSKRLGRMLSRSKGSRSVKKPDFASGSNTTAAGPTYSPPEVTVARSISLFCETSGTEASGNEEEVLYLPVIVEAAESSPAAAAAAALQIRKFLGKEYSSKPHVQYNAIMLIRILTDNPGSIFTQNFDLGFVHNVKELLRGCKDASTQRIMRETLDTLEATKQDQPGLNGLVLMWRKEKGYDARLSVANGAHYPQPWSGNFNGSRQGSHPQRIRLPPPTELAARLAEANNTAGILLQLVHTTPTEEFLGNDLIKEFRQRCQTAQRNIEDYINCDDPPPDDNTMLTLIETNEQLSLATTRYQRCVLAARKAMGPTPRANPPAILTQTNQSPMAATRAYNESAFATSPAPVLASMPGHDYSAFAPRPYGDNTSAFVPRSNNDYQPLSGPPQGAIDHLNSGTTTGHFYSPQSAYQQQMPPSDPFADPMHNPTAPLHQNPTFNGPATHRSPQAAPAEAFTINAEPSYPPRRVSDPDTSHGHIPARLDTTHSTASGPTLVSAISNSPQDQTWPSSSQNVSPQSPRHEKNATASYIGRQNNAVNGLTMHGAMERASESSISEIDGHPEVGRTDQPAGVSPRESAYSSSPIEARHLQR